MMIPTHIISKQLIKNTLHHLNQDLPGFSAVYFQNTQNTKRKTFSFGYDYFSMSDGNRAFIPIPEYLQTLCQSCIDSFGKEKELGHFKDYLNIIVSIYDKGYHLEPHVDVDESDEFTDGKPVDFYFGKSLFGVILEADEAGRLYFIKSETDNPIVGKKILELDETTGMTFLISGVLRNKPYYHGVSKVKKSRISITFRTVRFKASS